MSDEHHEVVIIKRGGGDHEEGHHGGAWKIAFADFMTAMMAFFLVMWLLSASDKTKAVIAHYFNPVQLVDSTPQPKGLQDLKNDAASIMKYSNVEAKDKSAKDADSKEKPPEDAKAASEGKAPVQTAAAAKADKKELEPDKTAKHEAELFRDPYAVLAEIAAKNDSQPKVSKKASTDGAKGGSGAIGLKGGEAYRDPFDPMTPPPSAAGNDASLASVAAEAVATPPAEPVPAATKPAAGKADKGDKGDKTAPGAMASDAAPPVETPAEKAETAALAAKVEAAAKPDPGTKAANEPKVDVHRTKEGLVIGLTDGANFAMFASASAEPSPQTVALMAKIGKILKDQKGTVTIRGFTDNRPFRSDTYDNWRLSSARADMAHYMLVRGGLDDSRIERIEGYADRRPKNPKNPGGPENRRIEILLREPTP